MFLFVVGLEHNLSPLAHFVIRFVNSFSVYYVFYNTLGNMIYYIYWKRYANVYTMDYNDIHYNGVKYLVARGEDAYLWHRRLGHASMRLLQNFCEKELIRFTTHHFQEY